MSIVNKILKQRGFAARAAAQGLLNHYRVNMAEVLTILREDGSQQRFLRMYP